MQYACGGWLKNNPIPSGKSSWSTFKKLWQVQEIFLKTIPHSQKILRTTRTHCGWCLSGLPRKRKRDAQPAPRRALITMPALTSEISLGWQKLKLVIDTRQAQMGTLFRLWLVCQEWDIGETRRNTSIGTSFRHDNKSYLFTSWVILLILVGMRFFSRSYFSGFYWNITDYEKGFAGGFDSWTLQANNTVFLVSMAPSLWQFNPRLFSGIFNSPTRELKLFEMSFLTFGFNFF